MTKTARLSSAVLLGLLAGLGGETLLFLERQCWRIEETLRRDFRVVLFLKGEPPETRLKVVEERLLALPDVDEVRYISARDALAALHRQEPELVDAVTLVGENPLQPAFEVRLDGEGIARLPEWIAQAEPAGDWADIRYKPAQAQALLQARFYGHFLSLVFSASLLAAGGLGLLGVWTLARRPRAWAALAHGGLRAAAASAGTAAASAGGAAAGAALAALMALPMRLYTPWWAWPSGPRQLFLGLGAALAGWVLCGNHGD